MPLNVIPYGAWNSVAPDSRGEGGAGSSNPQVLPLQVQGCSVVSAAACVGGRLFRVAHARWLRQCQPPPIRQRPVCGAQGSAPAPGAPSDEEIKAEARLLKPLPVRAHQARNPLAYPR